MKFLFHEVQMRNLGRARRMKQKRGNFRRNENSFGTSFGGVQCHLQYNLPVFLTHKMRIRHHPYRSWRKCGNTFCHSGISISVSALPYRQENMRFHWRTHFGSA